MNRHERRARAAIVSETPLKMFVNPASRSIKLEFGRALRWFTLSTNLARHVARSLADAADDIDRLNPHETDATMVTIKRVFVCDLCGREPKPRDNGPARPPEGYAIRMVNGSAYELNSIDSSSAKDGEKVICAHCVTVIRSESPR